MRVLILSRNAELYSTKRLVQAAKARGHEVDVRDTLGFAIHIQNPPRLTCHGRSIEWPEIVLPRIGASITFYGLAVVRQFEQKGIPVLNGSRAIGISRDKFHALQLLSAKGFPIPPTALVRQEDDIQHVIEDVGGVPVVIKLIEGTQGAGVFFAESLEAAQSMMEVLHKAEHNILIQKFVAEAKGRDIRAFVIGDKVVAAMRRVASKPSEFRSNMHRGGQAEGLQLSPELTDLAVRAARTVGLVVAGVDMLETPRGPLLIEVNSSPGLEGIEKAAGVDIAEAIIAYSETIVS